MKALRLGSADAEVVIDDAEVVMTDAEVVMADT